MTCKLFFDATLVPNLKLARTQGQPTGIIHGYRLTYTTLGSCNKVSSMRSSRHTFFIRVTFHLGFKIGLKRLKLGLANK